MLVVEDSRSAKGQCPLSRPRAPSPKYTIWQKTVKHRGVLMPLAPAKTRDVNIAYGPCTYSVWEIRGVVALTGVRYITTVKRLEHGEAIFRMTLRLNEKHCGFEPRTGRGQPYPPYVTGGRKTILLAARRHHRQPGAFQAWLESRKAHIVDSDRMIVKHVLLWTKQLYRVIESSQHKASKCFACPEKAWQSSKEMSRPNGIAGSSPKRAPSNSLGHLFALPG